MSGRDGFGLATLRNAVRQRAEQTSIRSAAAEIGMSYTGLRGFLGGGKPHAETLRRLVAWYAQRRSGTADAVRPKDVEAALTLLTHYIEQAGTPALLRERMDEVMHTLSRPAAGPSPRPSRAVRGERPQGTARRPKRSGSW